MKNKRILKLVGSICMVVVLTLTLVLVSGCDVAEEPEYKIGIFQIASHPALDSAREGFKDAFKAALEAKNLTEADVVFTESNAAGNIDLCYTIADYFVGQGVDLICAIATPCAIAAATAVEGTDIPVVFNSVTEPVDAGVVNNWTVPGGQVTGVSDIAPVEPQLQLILDIFEANNLTLNKLGIMYSTGEPNSVYQVDVQLPQALDDLGLTGNVTVVKATVSTGADIPAAAQTLVAAAVDAIWVPTDNTVVTGIEALIGPCEEEDIPLFAADTSTVERGVIGCWGMDYYLVGNYSGQMAAEILLNGANPATMPVQILPADLLYLNTQAAENMGEITIPQWLIDMAYEVVED